MTFEIDCFKKEVVLISNFRSLIALPLLPYLIFSKFLFLVILYFGKIEGAPFRDYLVTIDTKEIDSGIELVDAIYFLNLDKRPDRLEYMNDTLNKCAIHAIRVSACDENQICEHIIHKLTGRYYKDSLLLKNKQRNYRAAIGCLLTHLSILQDAFLKGFQRGGLK